MKDFSSQPILVKIRILTAVIIIAFILALILSFGTYWFMGSRRNMEEEAIASTEAAAASLDNSLKSITESFVSIFGTDAFALELTDMLSPKSDITRNRVILQDELTRLSSASNLITSALIFDVERGEVYSLFRDVMIKSRAQVIWNSELETLKGISVLPERPSPLRGQESIIPMVFPIEFQYGGAVISEGRGNFIVIVLLSAEDVREGLPDDSILFTRGIRITGESPMEGENGIFSYTATLPFSSLSLIHYLNLNERLVGIIGTAGVSIAVAIAALLILVIVFSVMIRRYVTRPIGKLKASVMEIEKGNYSVKADFESSDELGELRDAISRMAHTIDSQITAIKEEQEKQTKTEMRLLTEQLTPHFLYNTLECIQQEIQNGNSKASSEMTRALSLYLRTVLAYGSETISIKNEIQHEMSYIRIMNGRFRKDIIYQYTLPPEIQNEEILKMTLQPFIENSIKHGFGIGDGSTWVQQPEISVSFSVSDGRIRLEAADNGKGFDENELLAIMHGEGSEGHIGIRNTYLRLIKFYGEENVAVNVSSIPYYRSVITIEVPIIGKR